MNFSKIVFTLLVILSSLIGSANSKAASAGELPAVNRDIQLLLQTEDLEIKGAAILTRTTRLELYRVHNFTPYWTTGPHVREIRKQLVMTRDLPAAADNNSALFGRELKGAVEAYQKRHALDSDGIVGRQTIASPDVTAGISFGRANNLYKVHCAHIPLPGYCNRIELAKPTLVGSPQRLERQLRLVALLSVPFCL